MLSEHTIAEQHAVERYKERSTRSRFLQQIFLGLGGATVFGFVGVLSKELLGAAIETSAAATAGGGTALAGLLSAPVLGLVGIAVLGIGCLYVGAKYLSNTIMMEQDYQATKIAIAARGKSPEITQSTEIQHTKPTSVPITMGATERQSPDAQENAPQLQIHAVEAHQKLGLETERARQA